MKKDFITVSPDNGGGVSRAITVNQDGIPLMPVVGLNIRGVLIELLGFHV